MCGIIGFSGTQTAYRYVYEGLLRLEYRGYDSAGVAYHKNGGFEIIKEKGRVAEVLPTDTQIDADTVIGHTRWATHGAPCARNAHPHAVGKVCIVHNGIIENYASLRERVTANGTKIVSDTDTEIACALISEYYDKLNDPIKALSAACKEMSGSYALCVMFADIPGRIYATRKESPLLIVPFDNITAICSDLTAIDMNYSSYYIPDENEIAEISGSQRTFYDFYGKKLIKAPITGNARSYSSSLDGFSSYMEKEIYVQPEIISRLLREYAPNGTVSFGFELPHFSKLRMIACGTAYHAALTASHFFRSQAKIHTECFLASEFRYAEFIPEDDALYVVISQSGETADTIAAMRHIQAHGERVLGIVNAPNSTIEREADLVIQTLAGAELAVASTKAFTAQVLTLVLLCAAVSGNNSADAFLPITEAISATIADRERLGRVSAALAESEHAYYIGRQVDHALACEGSLKLKEITYIHSEAIAAGELKHGTLSLITHGTPVIAVITHSSTVSKLVSNIEEIISRGGNVFAISTPADRPKCLPDENCILLPNGSELTSLFTATVALQMIALNTATRLNRDVDKPRNLAKSVTVE